MDQVLSFVVVSTDAGALRELRTVISSDGSLRLVTALETLDQASAEISRLRPSAAIVVVDSDQAFSLLKRLSIENPDTVIVCASRDSSSDFILKSIRSGAREFLRLPISAEEFATVIDRTAEFCVARNKDLKKLGKTVAVFSSKGGCGNSFIAANIAAALKSQTALIDLNTQAGDVDLFFGITPRFSLVDLVENRSRLDDSLLSGYMTSYSSTLSLLPAPRETAAAEDLNPQHVAEVLHMLRQRYDYVVLDPHHTLDSVTLAALDHCDDILLVLTLDVSSIRSAQRSLEIFDRLGYPRKKVRVIVNRWTKQIDVQLQQVERFLGERVVAFVPNDYRAAVNSVNLGKPLVESHPTSSIALEIKKVAAILSGETEGDDNQSKGLLSSLFRRQQPTPLDLKLNLDEA